MAWVELKISVQIAEKEGREYYLKYANLNIADPTSVVRNGFGDSIGSILDITGDTDYIITNGSMGVVYTDLQFKNLTDTGQISIISVLDLPPKDEISYKYYFDNVSILTYDDWNWDSPQTEFRFYNHGYVYIPDPLPILFDNNNNSVDFNNLLGRQKDAVKNGADVYHAQNGTDIVTLPGSVAAASAAKFTPGNTFYGEGGDDIITEGKLDDWIDGGAEQDTVKFNGPISSYVIGGEVVSGYGNLVVQRQEKRKTVETDTLTDVEKLEFAGKLQHVTKWAELVPVSSIKGLNVGSDGKKLKTPGSSFLEDLLGTPVNNDDGIFDISHHVREMLARDKATITIDGVTYTGLKPVVDSLNAIFAKAGGEVLPIPDLPVLIDNLSSAGILVPRHIAGTNSYSSHSWGTAIDLKVDGILDHVADGQLHRALATITPYFNKAGWVAGSGFSTREDDMHFQASEQLLKTWFPVLEGRVGADNLAGSAKDELLQGLIGNDVLRGGGGIDTLEGDTGNDRLLGASGADFFVFDTALNAKTNVDRIYRFSAADEIELDDAVFKAAGKEGHTLENAHFRIGNAARDADDRIIYNSTTGALSYDPDGSGRKTAVEFAVLDKHPALSAVDFFIV